MRVLRRACRPILGSWFMPLCTAAALGGATRWKAIHEWIQSLSPAVLDEFNCRQIDGVHQRPSIYCIRNIMTMVDPDRLAGASTRATGSRAVCPSWQQGVGHLR